MITLGFAAGYSDLATLDSEFPYPSSYIYISGDTGNVVWQNSNGANQYLPNAQSGGLYPIGAKMILSSGTVNGTSRTTTATDIVYLSSAKGV
ncbi:hypothetical protein KW791_00110 [Candidatus Parcubacteria bacterium]|nr:hypothetical protein [Candidatus Parcubacteria bacterium]